MIIKRPLISEKTLALASRGWYTFAVDIASSKPSISQAISSAYKVEVVSVRTITMHGKVRRVGKKSTHVSLPNWKKAMVTLKKGQKIDVFEVTPPEAKGEGKQP